MKLSDLTHRILTNLANRSNMTSKHGCIAIYKGKIVSSSFNYSDQRVLQKRHCRREYKQREKRGYSVRRI